MAADWRGSSRGIRLAGALFKNGVTETAQPYEPVHLAEAIQYQPRGYGR